jgi:hypothetical protein
MTKQDLPSSPLDLLQCPLQYKKETGSSNLMALHRLNAQKIGVFEVEVTLPQVQYFRKRNNLSFAACADRSGFGPLAKVQKFRSFVKHPPLRMNFIPDVAGWATIHKSANHFLSVGTLHWESNDIDYGLHLGHWLNKKQYAKFKRDSSPINRDTPARISPRTRFLILERDGFTCQCCGASAPEARLEVDHRLPVSKGGGNHETNLWTLCEPCNRGKSNLVFEKLLP